MRKPPGPEPEEVEDPLAGFLAAVSAPLHFLVQASPQAAARTRIPAAALAERGRLLVAETASLPRRLALEAVCATLSEMAALEATAAEPVDRTSLARRCLSEIEALRALPSRPPPSPYRRSSASPTDDHAALGQPLQYVRGIGPRRAALFERMGLSTIEDLLYHLPFRYEDRRRVCRIADARPGDVVTVAGEITHLAERFVGRTQRRILEAAIRDDSGLLALTWFHQVAYFRDRWRVGQSCLVHGKVEGVPGTQKRIVHPEIEEGDPGHGAGILPVYQKPTTVSVNVMRTLVQQVVRDHSERLPSVLPARVVQAAGVTDLGTAMRQIHLPDREADVDELNECRSVAHRSLVFDELFFLQLGMALRRRSLESEPGLALPETGELTRRFREALPFRYTRAQERVLKEILADMARPQPMHRLVQGDVGSGKTVVALHAALVAIENGWQAAILAPTELLAEQHYATVARYVEPLGVSAALVTGGRARGERRRLLSSVKAGEISLIVGTHALIQEGVEFARLGLGIVDEQHRFGVLQRAALRTMGGEGGATPDMLLMTATPIPRTLAMTVYGDLEVSALDERPPGRTPIRTVVRAESERARIYEGVRRELDRGRQGYVVYPLVEANEEVPLRDATTMAEELARTVFQGYRVGLLHGRMKPAEKDAVMRRFKDGDLQLLVSTTVIEVGIDVPNASVLVVEHAERFGLSQLHQLRGRVGRGTAASTCILLAPFQRGDTTERRLQAMAQTDDGFRIAEVDLALRGPGEMLGTRQSGLPDFRVANLIRDRGILEEARRAADVWLAADPRLADPESLPLREVLRHRWAGRLALAQIG